MVLFDCFPMTSPPHRHTNCDGLSLAVFELFRFLVCYFAALVRGAKKLFASLFDGMCVTLAEWSKALSSFFCVRSRNSPGLEPSQGAHRQATHVVDGGFGHGRSTLPYLQHWGRLGPLHEHRRSQCVAVLVWGGGKTATERR